MSNQPSYAKSFAIKSIMNNPKLADVLFASWEAPVGSTKNARAKSVMKSLERSANNYVQDGKGGPGLQAAAGTLLNTFNPFAGQLFNTYGATKNIFGPTNVANAASNPILNQQTPQQTSTSTPSSSPLNIGSGMNIPMPETSVNSTPKYGDLGQPQEPTGSVFIKTADDLTPVVSQPETQEQVQMPDGSTMPAAPSTSTTQTTDLLSSYKDIMTKYGVGESVSDLPDYLSDIGTAVEAGVGPTTFATQALADKTMLAKILQLPKEAVNWLPESGFLSDYLVDLKQETKDRYQIDNQLKRILDLENRGLTVESDLQSYIRGKDEYLGKLDKMYEDASEKIAYMDTSDPADAKRMGNYLNYLTILKGRQNQRYIDYLNTSVQTHENELSRATNLYKYTSELYKDEWEDYKNGATEKYGRLQDMLEEMYTNVEGREEELYTKEKRELDLINTALDVETSIINLQRKKEETTSSSTEFNTAIEQQLDELESGRDWGTAWGTVKRRFPNVADEEIDNALKGGIVKTEAQSKELGIPIGQPWGWAKPGAYKEWKSTTGTTSTSGPTNTELTQTIYQLWDLPKEQGGLKGYTDAEKAVFIRQAGLNPESFGIYE